MADGNIRYEHNTNASLSTIEGPSQQPTLLNLFNPPIASATPYSADGGFYHPAASHVFPTLDVRPRLGSNTSSTGMAHAHRSTALPHPGTHITTRDQYSPATPSYRRASEHQPRSPSYPTALRRHPISPTSSPITGFTAPAALRMDPGHYPSSSSRTQTSVPPLSPITNLGILQYTDGMQVKLDIHGNIDKGFFQSDGDWTCYRRNYFSCICSFGLTPHYPGQALQFTQQGSTQPYSVLGFAMSISAVVAENDSHTIELVQHTPKRDKGPVEKPGKVRLHPKHPQMSHPMGLYHGDSVLGGPSRIGFPDGGGYGGQQSGDSYQTEHTFERIQFKQATANNGKRRAAQQYYHLLIELWADVGSQGPNNFIRIAYRKSAKMIVRGRSPGHYQSERRASTSSGPGGSGGSFTGYPNSSIIGSDFGPAGAMVGGGYAAGFDTRGSAHYGSTRHHPELEHMLPPEDAKAIDTTKEYQYYPGTMYDGADSRGVEMFAHHRHGQDNMVPHVGSNYDPLHNRVKRDPEILPSIFQPGALMSTQRCGPFEGKSTSSGYYPTMVPQSGANVSNMT
ncbi:meiosis-specific transcription factor NDT80 [Colletotrichum spaethianum]|uniref:Meiosis-specific transcription factor NDT80 n=1 Tax=Colletotrichum spaethianum TaxID=700344 RepID=A0AA37LBK7_9PEZI|nr:meiosis-specific transcription factor NDT80 [Colletotrichum spaethianum]GKT45641.1 meiosis-specific transcription factor NDT80 [Colletotrichum spaethianum]